MTNSDHHNPLDQFVTNINRDKEEELTQKQAAKLGLDYKNMVGFQPDPAAVVVVPKDMAEQAYLFAFEKTGSQIGLALTDPANPATVNALKQLASLDEYEFRPVLVSASSLRYLLGLYDTFAPTTVSAETISIDETMLSQFTNLASLSDLQAQLVKGSTSEMVELILAGAIALEASDIHIEPTSSALRLRYRLDGVLQDVASLPIVQLDPIINRIKLQSSLKLNIHENAQDGRFSVTAPDGQYDLRVSILPSQYGETLVIRLLPQKGRFISLEDLGFSSTDLEKINHVISQPNGLVLNTGPTGSGKTTTLYSILSKLNQTERKIITVEDPIEYRLEGITQTQVNDEQDYSFANALRAIVRQDPDVILVGEIRDTETAEIAINAALTGHLVLSTLHTNDAGGAIPRLTDLGAKPTIYSDALRLIIAQRLMRKLCPECKKARALTAEEQRQLTQLNTGLSLPSQTYEGVGCTACNNTGYKGRFAIYELMEITPELRAKIVAGATATELTQLAVSQGMTTLAASGLSKVSDGTSSLDEFFRVVASDN